MASLLNMHRGKNNLPVQHYSDDAARMIEWHAPLEITNWSACNIYVIAVAITYMLHVNTIIF